MLGRMQARLMVIVLSLLAVQPALAALRYELTNNAAISMDGVARVDENGVWFRPLNAGGTGVIANPITAQYAWRFFKLPSLRQLRVDIAAEKNFLNKLPDERVRILAKLDGQLVALQGGPVAAPAPAAVAATNAAAPAVGGAAPPVLPNLPDTPASSTIPPAPLEALGKKSPLAPIQIESWPGIPIGFQQRSANDAPAVTFLSALLSPIAIFFILMAVGVNLYLAREVAHHCQRPVKTVCGLSLLGPYIVPLIFLLLPEPGAAPAVEAAPKKKKAQAKAEVAAVESPAEAPAAEQAATEHAGGYANATAYFHQSQVRFNKSFCDRELIRFMRMTPHATEWLVVRTRQEEMWACRIASATQDGLTLVVAANDVWDERVLTYFKIVEMQIIPAA